MAQTRTSSELSDDGDQQSKRAKSDISAFKVRDVLSRIGGLATQIVTLLETKNTQGAKLRTNGHDQLIEWATQIKLLAGTEITAQDMAYLSVTRNISGDVDQIKTTINDELKTLRHQLTE